MSNEKLDFSMGHINSEGKCWICGSTLSLEYHHIIPRAYGGEHGPQVGLCADHHSAIHLLSESDIDKVGLDALTIFKGLSKIGLTKAIELAIIIIRARHATKDDQNKTAVFMDRFPAKTRNQLKRLASYYKTNQKKVVRQAIEELHNRIFK